MVSFINSEVQRKAYKKYMSKSGTSKRKPAGTSAQRKKRFELLPPREKRAAFLRMQMEGKLKKRKKGVRSGVELSPRGTYRSNLNIGQGVKWTTTKTTGPKKAKKVSLKKAASKSISRVPKAKKAGQLKFNF